MSKTPYYLAIFHGRFSLLNKEGPKGKPIFGHAGPLGKYIYGLSEDSKQIITIEIQKMNKGGRFGKYGEIKRMSRLRKAKTSHPCLRGAGAHATLGAAFQKKKKPEKSKIGIRQAKRSDAAFIQDLSKLVFSRYGPYEDMLSGWLESDITISFLAFTKKCPAGFAMLGRHPHEGDSQRVAELLAIAVEPTKQKRGVGDFLMNKILRVAKKLRIEIVVLHTAIENRPAQRLFAKHMFTPSGIKKGFYPKGQDAVLMVNHIKYDGHEAVF